MPITVDMNPNQAVTVQVSLVDAAGNPAEALGDTTFVSGTPANVVTRPLGDGISAEIVSVGPLGAPASVVTVTATGAGGPIVDTITVNVVSILPITMTILDTPPRSSALLP